MYSSHFLSDTTQFTSLLVMSRGLSNTSAGYGSEHPVVCNSTSSIDSLRDFGKTTGTMLLPIGVLPIVRLRPKSLRGSNGTNFNSCIWTILLSWSRVVAYLTHQLVTGHSIRLYARETETEFSGATSSRVTRIRPLVRPRKRCYHQLRPVRH